MRVHRLIPIAALAFAVACSDDATSPSSVNRPLFDVSPGTFGNEVTFTSANTPGGTHIQSGAISCTVNADLSISCTGYELAGVGHTNVDVSLTATYSADVACNNPAGGKNRNNDIEPQATILDATVSQDDIRAKNGRMDVQPMSIGPNTGGNPCPNVNWEAQFVNLALVSFEYTLTFDGAAGAFITIAQP